MTNDGGGVAGGPSGANDGGFEFGYDDEEEKKSGDDEKESSDEELRAKLGANRLAHREPVADSELNIDDI